MLLKSVKREPNCSMRKVRQSIWIKFGIGNFHNKLLDVDFYENGLSESQVTLERH
jgi:hypothetical protein